VVATAEAAAFIESHGGIAYVRPVRTKCCGGAMTMLVASTEPPVDAVAYAPVGPPELGVRFRRRTASSNGAVGEDGVAGPDELLIELKGKRRQRLVACWDGCVFKM
jgi:hypothetical protein